MMLSACKAIHTRFYFYAVLLLAVSVPAFGQNRMALTFDDLPVANYSQAPDASAIREQQEITEVMLAKLRQHRAPAIGFVNEVKVNTPGARDAYALMLQTWLDARMELGCHGYSHLSLSDASLQTYEDDFARGTVLTPLMMLQAGKTERYYRYPYNDTGDTAGKRDGFRAYLAAHQFQVAPMTLENDDWLYGALYDDALERQDAAMAAKIREAYLAENEQQLAFVEQLAGREFHRTIPQIADLHANRLNADVLERLLTQFEHHGYKFISLDDALADAAYRTPDPFVGRAGISWLERWAPVLGVTDPFKGDAEPPRWAMDAYKSLHRN